MRRVLSLADEGLLLVRLQLRDAAGKPLSRNLYWATHSPGAQRALCTLPQVELELSLCAIERQPAAYHFTLANRGQVPSLHNKLTLLDADGARVLPAYYSDNYISLLPGESIDVRIEAPGRAAALALRGWNAVAQTHILNQERS